MNHLMASQMVVLPGIKSEWYHDTVNGIMNGYYQSAEKQIRGRVAGLLHKSVMPIGELVHWTSDQPSKPAKIHLMATWSWTRRRNVNVIASFN